MEICQKACPDLLPRLLNFHGGWWMGFILSIVFWKEGALVVYMSRFGYAHRDSFCRESSLADRD